MANNLQKLIYESSVVSPILLAFSLVWFIQKRSLVVPIGCVSIAVMLMILMLKSFLYGKKRLAPIPIRVNDVTPCDGWIVVYIITYVFPFVSLAIDDLNVILCSIVGGFIVFVAANINTAIPNPILFFQGYHFYSISAENGVSGYILISRRIIRNKKSVRKVKRVFEFLVLETEG